AIAAGFAWLPIWGALMLLCWSRRGQSPGLAAMALRVVGRGDTPPSPLRALIRLLVLCAATGFGLLTAVLLVGAAAAAAQQTLPALLGLALLLPLALALADPMVWLLAPDHRPLHDLLAGTRVVRAAQPHTAVSSFTG
ncbi:MAG TPA: RDD family protein, partial [Dehalococcoidia bacterium]|nr:RDD family protein [Dehalococcoidia bacterium]